MKGIVAAVVAFAIGCIVATAVWALFPSAIPDESGRQTGEVLPPSVSPALEPSVDDLLAALEGAGTATEKAEAARRLSRIPIDEIPAILERIELVQGHRLALPAKLLLARWGSKDGRAAMDWAWRHVLSEGVWDQAYREVGASWAWSRPKEFGDWVRETIARTYRGHDTLTMEEAMKHDTPVLGFDAVNRACRWLVRSEPQLAFELRHLRAGHWSSDSDLVDALDSIAQVREALLAFGDPREFDSSHHLSLEQGMVEGLLLRWHELDPQDFKASPFADLPWLSLNRGRDPAFDEWSKLPPDGKAAGADRLVAACEPEKLAGWMFSISGEWTGTDPEAAAAWIATLPEENRELALQAHAHNRAVADPNGTIAWIAGLPAARRQACLVIAFDAWNQSGTESPPDRADWPADLRQAWADLEALADDRPE